MHESEEVRGAEGCLTARLAAAECSAAALAGWIYVYSSAGRVPIELSVAWAAAGIAAFLVWARVIRVWPFRPRRFREDYAATQP